MVPYNEGFNCVCKHFMDAKLNGDENEQVFFTKHSSGHRDILLLQMEFAVGLRLCKLLTRPNPQL